MWVSLLLMMMMTCRCAAAHLLCRQLHARSIGAGQPFQLPLDDDNDNYFEQERLLRRLAAPPWNLTAVRIRDGWLEVEPPQPYHQVELERAFECDIYS